MERNEAKTNDYSYHYGSIRDVFRRRRASLDPVKTATSALVEAITNNPVYREYQEAKKEILHYPPLKARMDEFRQKNYELQNTAVNILVETEKLQEEYAYILENPAVRRYLYAENSFCRMIQQVNWQLIEELDFEADFLGQALREAE